MSSEIQYPKGYRYDSDMELFKIAVVYTRDMLENEEMVILYQFIDVISAKVFISQDEFEQYYRGIDWYDFLNILNNEIIYLLRQCFDESFEKDTELKDYLQEKEVPEECWEKIVELKLEKCKYVKEYLGGEKERNRYELKNRSFLKRLSDIDCELSRTIDEEEILYASIRMSVNSTLEAKDIPKVLSNMFSHEKENITFICDKSDIEYLIQKLERIKQML
ncbi:MAG: hypothetical protein NC318_09010 [Blautia sp.]|nr:hypothetical protein [Lachnoclostridium sp.]MCM1211729.1 hypothetical protein [Blautia sp.]